MKDQRVTSFDKLASNCKLENPEDCFTHSQEAQALLHLFLVDISQK